MQGQQMVPEALAKMAMAILREVTAAPASAASPLLRPMEHLIQDSVGLGASDA